MKNLTQIDNAYNKSISDTFEKLKAVYTDINSNYKFDLSNTEITEAILNRLDWEQQYLERDKKLKAKFPNAKSFLLVMTGLNWSGFGDSSKLNDCYFCLLNDIWPNNYSDKSQIFTPIENLFIQLK